MRVKEAKDFLVSQTAEQAELEGVSLSDLEKRMMYFTEVGTMSEDPIQLNEEFEAQYETDAYEAKVSKLMSDAYDRLKKENPQQAHDWDQAIKTLRKGDHYILVLWDVKRRAGLSSTPLTYIPKVRKMSRRITIAACVFFFLVLLAARFGARKVLPTPNQTVLLLLFVALVLMTLFFPGVFNRALTWVLDKVLPDKEETETKDD